MLCTPEKPASVTETDTQVKEVHVAAAGDPESQMSAMTTENCVTILQTARVYVIGENTVEATLLFDNGSDRSYVTSSLVKKASLKPVSKVSVTYTPFGGGKSGSHMRNVFNLQTRGVLGEGVRV